jgi:hypothetical protein
MSLGTLVLRITLLSYHLITLPNSALDSLFLRSPITNFINNSVQELRVDSFILMQFHH